MLCSTVFQSEIRRCLLYPSRDESNVLFFSCDPSRIRIHYVFGNVEFGFSLFLLAARSYSSHLLRFLFHDDHISKAESRSYSDEANDTIDEPPKTEDGG